MVHRKHKHCSENGTQIKVFNAYATKVTKRSKIPLAKNHQRYSLKCYNILSPVIVSLFTRKWYSGHPGAYFNTQKFKFQIFKKIQKKKLDANCIHYDRAIFHYEYLVA
jgi:hypothetical protein